MGFESWRGSDRLERINYLATGCGSFDYAFESMLNLLLNGSPCINRTRGFFTWTWG